jgi:hypothetical protein
MSKLCKDYKPSLSKKDKEDCLKNCVLYTRNHKQFCRAKPGQKGKLIEQKEREGHGQIREKELCVDSNEQECLEENETCHWIKHVDNKKSHCGIRNRKEEEFIQLSQLNLNKNSNESIDVRIVFDMNSTSGILNRKTTLSDMNSTTGIFNRKKTLSDMNSTNYKKLSETEIKGLINETIFEYGESINIFGPEFVPYDVDVVENFLVAYIQLSSDRLDIFKQKIDKFNKSTVQNKTKYIGDKNSKGVYIKNIYIIPETYNLQ